MNAPPGYKQRISFGFTLVEVLVAMTLFSITLLLIFSALHSAGRSWHVGEQQVERNDAQRLGLQFLRRYIGQAVPLMLIDNRDNRILFKGERDAVHFITGLPSHRGNFGLYSVSVLLERSGTDQPQLVVRYMPVDPDKDFFASGDSAAYTTQELLVDIEAVEFEYYGRVQARSEPGWSSVWEAKDRLPELVRIRILPANTDLSLSELSIAIRNQITGGQPQLVIHAGQPI